jgi:AraC-like DNA-binding protein
MVRGPHLDMRLLWSTPTFQVLTSTWDRQRHPIDSKRQAESASIEWMRVGTYCKQVRGAEVVGDTNTAVFFNPGEDFRVSHGDMRSNCGTTIRLEKGFLNELLTELGSNAMQSVGRPFQQTHTITSPACYLLQQRLISLLGGADAEPLVVEEMVYRLLAMVLDVSSRKQTPIGVVAARRLALVQEFLNASFRQKLSLVQVAAIAGCSPWRICHVFSLGTGLSISRYLGRTRLRRALALIHETDRGLAAIALETGFSSHSHMSAMFRREFGMTPTESRRPATWN